MPYCPRCRAEYVAETRRCSDCDVDLVDLLPPSEARQADADDFEVVELASFASVPEAEMFKELLEGSGIESVITHCDTEAMLVHTPAAGNIIILVEKHKLVEAREIYEAYFAGEVENADIESSETEPA